MQYVVNWTKSRAPVVLKNSIILLLDDCDRNPGFNVRFYVSFWWENGTNRSVWFDTGSNNLHSSVRVKGVQKTAMMLEYRRRHNGYTGLLVSTPMIYIVRIALLELVYSFLHGMPNYTRTDYVYMGFSCCVCYLAFTLWLFSCKYSF